MIPNLSGFVGKSGMYIHHNPRSIYHFKICKRVDHSLDEFVRTFDFHSIELRISNIQTGLCAPCIHFREFREKNFMKEEYLVEQNIYNFRLVVVVLSIEKHLKSKLAINESRYFFQGTMNSLNINR